MEIKLSKLLFLLIIFSQSINAQILDKYPKGQNFYSEGISNFMNDAHNFVMENKLQKCPKEQIYFARFIVTAENEVKFVKDFDEANIKKNQCAYDLTLNILKNLKNFTSAKVDGKNVASEAEIIIYPDDLFENFENRGNFYANYVPAKYKKGNDRFKKDLHNNFESLFYSYHINANFVLDFYIDSDGNIVNPDVHPKIEDANFAKEFVRTLHWMDGKFEPATYKGIPVKSRLTIPMSFQTKLYVK